MRMPSKKFTARRELRIFVQLQLIKVVVFILSKKLTSLCGEQLHGKADIAGCLPEHNLNSHLFDWGSLRLPGMWRLCFIAADHNATTHSHSKFFILVFAFKVLCVCGNGYGTRT